MDVDRTAFEKAVLLTASCLDVVFYGIADAVNVAAHAMRSWAYRRGTARWRRSYEAQDW